MLGKSSRRIVRSWFAVAGLGCLPVAGLVLRVSLLPPPGEAETRQTPRETPPLVVTLANLRAEREIREGQLSELSSARAETQGRIQSAIRREGWLSLSDVQAATALRD